MATNSTGEIFRITTWGESHGVAIGVVIDGCPAGLPITVDEINHALAQRAPGNNPYTSPRKEQDLAEILSGVFEGQTTGAPISIMIRNKDADSSKYEAIKNIYRPGHANYTYLKKYGCFDYRGGGRASARETACRVAAGAVAKKILATQNIELVAYMQAIGGIRANHDMDMSTIKKRMTANQLCCPDTVAAEKMVAALAAAKKSGDSLGGIVAVSTSALPIGLGDPVYQKLEAKLASAYLSIPASKGFEIGEGFCAAAMQGSHHNDSFAVNDKHVTLSSNHAGGTLGGITNGEPLIARVAFKPTSSIKTAQSSVDTQGNATAFQLPEGSRHDPCVAIRAIPVVEAMTALVLVDCLLMNRCSRLDP